MSAMESIETGQIMSALFLGALLIYLLMAMRGRRMQSILRNASIWALVFVAAIAGFGVWEDIRQDMPQQAVFSDSGRVELPRHRDGHYYMTLDINGTPVDFVVDTGASEIVLTKEDATRAGLDVDRLQYYGRANTANGEVRTAPVRLEEISVAGIRDRDVPAFVNEGEMFQSLLGMSYLNRWDRIEIADGKLVLNR